MLRNNSKLNNTRSEFFSDRVHFYLLNIKANLARELIMDMYPTDGCIGRFNKLYSSSQYYKYLDSFLFIRSAQEEDLSHHISLTTAQEEENHDKLMVLASSLITQCMDTTDPQFLYILENFVKTPTDSKESRSEKANREAAAEMLSSCNTNTDNKNANDENEEDEVEGSDFVVDDNLTAACEMLPVFYNETVSNSTNNLDLGERYLSILYGINIDNFSSEVLADPILTDAQKYIDEKNSGNETNSSNSSSGASCIKNDPNTYDELLQTINSSIAPPGWEAEYLNYNYNIPIEMDKDCLYEYILTQTENLSTSLEADYDIPTFLKAMEMFREEDTDLYSENQDVFDTLLGQAINGIVVETPDENQFSKTMEEIPTSAFSTFLKSNSKAVKLHEKLANSDATLYANENFAKYIDSSVRNAFYDENLEEIMYDCAFGEEETTVICKNSVNRLNVLKYLKSLDLQNLEVKNLSYMNRLVSSHKQCFCSGEAEDSEESDIDDSLGDPWEILKEWLKKNASALIIPLDMKVYDKGSMLGEPKDYARLQLRKRLMEKNFLQLFNITKDEINQWAIEHEEKKADKIYTKFRAGQIIDYYRTIEN
ncbi:MAG: hypothetical protein MHPSP_000451 [Paramarteilia canceri]